MKTIGIIGGMSYESTLDYYKIINQEVNKRLGGLHSAKIIIESYDFSQIEKLQSAERWDELTDTLISSAKKLEKAGVDYVAIATNTMHIAAPDVQENISVPLIHIASACANYAIDKNFDTVALLGTKYTMTLPFYKDKLKNDYNINVVIPDLNQQEIINEVIYGELCKGILKKESEIKINNIILDCASKGAQAAILGCTELPLLIKDSYIELINSTRAHCIEIVNRILE